MTTLATELGKRVLCLVLLCAVVAAIDGRRSERSGSVFHCTGGSHSVVVDRRVVGCQR